MKEQKSKTRQALEHLIHEGELTSWQAITRHRNTRLSGTIFKLRKSGYNILTTIKKGTNGTEYGVYWLEPAQRIALQESMKS